MRNRLPAVAISILCAAPLPLAEEAGGEEPHAEHPANVIALFSGLVAEDRRDDGFALGVEYERRVSERFGIGALAEHTFGDIDATVYAVPFALHLGRWKAVAAPGLEEVDGENEGLVRIGAELAFEVGERLELSPQIDVDFVDGDTVFVFGLAIGRGF